MAFVAVYVYPQSMTIDEAIRTTASEMGQRLSKGNQIAVLSFSSQWQGLSAYVVDEMNNAIVRDGSLTVVDRLRLDLARQELNFGLSGDVSDESAQSIGQFLGAQLVLTGSYTIIGGMNRFRIQVITVETGVMVYSNSLTITEDNILTALTPRPQQPPRPPRSTRQRPTIFDDWTLYNGLTIFGYTYSFDAPLGFSLGAYGVYTSLGFAVNNWDGYERIGTSSSDTRRYSTVTAPNFNLHPYTEETKQIINWAIGYNFTIIPNVLYLPLGVGVQSNKEWRLQILRQEPGEWPFDPEWNPKSSQWETSFLFEAGLLFRVITPVNFAPYIFGSYRNIGMDNHSFSVGVGGSFDFLQN
jgi:TolB-like protein